MAWVALKAVYMAQPSRIAKPATCSVRANSLRRTCRNLARSGAAVTLGGYVAPTRELRPVTESEVHPVMRCLGMRTLVLAAASLLVAAGVGGGTDDDASAAPTTHC